MRIVWDEPKRLSNLDKHGFDFADLTEEYFLQAVVVPARGTRLQAIGSLVGSDGRRGLRAARERGPLGHLDAAGEQEGQEVCIMTGKFRPGRGYTRRRLGRGLGQPADSRPRALAEARPFAEVFPDLAESIRRSRGRPPKADAKLAVTLRLDPDTVERFKRQGPDWRARMGAALKRAAGG